MKIVKYKDFCLCFLGIFIPVIVLLSFALCALKMAGVLEIPWLVVFAPVGSLLIATVIVLLYAIIVLILANEVNEDSEESGDEE
jgi:membrane protein implicated in regulation of membrane protease activity